MNVAPARSQAHIDVEEEAAERLARGRKLHKGESDFFDALYRNAAPEDINRLAPEALAALSRMAQARLMARKPGNSAVDLFLPGNDWPDYPRNESVLIAINDDMPFLFDSAMGELHAQGVRVRAVFHPIVDFGGRQTSVIVAALEPVHDLQRCQAIVAALRKVFVQVFEAVQDWRAMLDKLKESEAGLRAHPPAVGKQDLDEYLAFLEWLGDNHFTFLGCRDYHFQSDGEGRLVPVLESGLGVLRDGEARVLRGGADRASLTPQIREFLTRPEPIIITKANERSLVHRRVHMDYVGVKTFDAKGNLTGERRFVGLFTSGAYSRRPSEIPLLRHKVEKVKSRAGLVPNSHDGKALAHILDNFPREELFQISEDELFETALGILKLGERPKVRVFLRFDRFDRFVSALVFVPRDRYDTQARETIHAILADAFQGRTSAATPVLDDTPLARVHYIVGRDDGPRPKVEPRALEERIRDAIRTWDDGFADALAARHGESEGTRLYQAREARFSPGYTGIFPPQEAAIDLVELEQGLPLKARAYRKDGDAANAVRFKLYMHGPVMPLSTTLPIFENLGMKVIAEDSFTVRFKDDHGVNHDCIVLDFQMERTDGAHAALDDIKGPLEDAFGAVVSRAAENDGFNRLVIRAGLSWRDVTILRAAAKYLRQAGVTFSQDYMEQALARNPDIAKLLVELFHARNDPKEGERREGRVRLTQTRIDKALGDVPSLDDDRIIRRLRNVMACVLRTNFYQPGAQAFAMKLDSQKLDELPAPRPLVEISVYSPLVEGVHLRFGKVARGGIRWSDRREDFRTEVLGLVKAQQVKNAVIVPVGAKGGFFPKQMPAAPTREQFMDAGIAAYKVFIGALLDVTDNLHFDGSVVPPPDCVRHDGDDPYLV
ncbi:MAG: NAD-glutamate dehydrogenase, partial [Alphaproteobacteria bacterium]|nr:NAD-glutamate dehydrogenase [Alphaproteobacteria bacterium]